MLADGASPAGSLRRDDRARRPRSRPDPSACTHEELARFRAERPRTLAAPGARPRPHAERDADGVDGLRQRPAGLRRSRRGRAVHRRRRVHLRRLQRERPGDVLRPCAPRDRSRGPGAGRALDPVPTADRGLDRGRRGARAPLPASRRIWQFTLSATQANTEAIRLARAVTDREVVVLFEGHYHGHFDEGLVDREDGHEHPCSAASRKASPAGCGSPSSTTPTRSPRRSRPDDVALVLTEPAMTQRHPLPGTGRRLARRAARRHPRARHGARVRRDAHARRRRGRRDRAVGLEPDIVTIGKAVAGGIPMGAYGVTPALARELDVERNVATGGTLFGNPLSAAAAQSPRSPRC